MVNSAMMLSGVVRSGSLRYGLDVTGIVVVVVVTGTIVVVTGTTVVWGNNTIGGAGSPTKVPVLPIPKANTAKQTAVVTSFIMIAARRLRLPIDRRSPASNLRKDENDSLWFRPFLDRIWGIVPFSHDDR